MKIEHFDLSQNPHLGQSYEYIWNILHWRTDAKYSVVLSPTVERNRAIFKFIANRVDNCTDYVFDITSTQIYMNNREAQFVGHLDNMSFARGKNIGTVILNNLEGHPHYDYIFLHMLSYLRDEPQSLFVLENGISPVYQRLLNAIPNP